MRGPILVSLGSNVDPVASIGRALAELKRALSVTATSAVYRSAPVGAPGTPDFYNAALELETDLDPRALKWDVLRPIEARIGRVRSEDRNAPRPIDLDLALYGSSILDGENSSDGLAVRVPDPDILRFLHVARPLADIAGDFVHPMDGRSLAQIAHELEETGEFRLVRVADRIEAVGDSAPDRDG